MLRCDTDIYCGIFDSAIMRNSLTKSKDRHVRCYELELFHSEGGVSHVDGVAYPTRRGMLLCAKPDQIRYSDFPVRCSFIRVFVNENTADIADVLDKMPTCTYLEDTESVERLLGLYSRLGGYMIGSRDTLAEIAVNSVFFEILHSALRLSLSAPLTDKISSPNRIAREAYEYINENYSEDCSLGRIASAVKVSPNHLHAVFCEHVGMTPYEYVLSKRIQKAKMLIMTGEKSMLEIALETGFCSQSHFNKVFRKQTGMTPMEYREDLYSGY